MSPRHRRIALGSALLAGAIDQAAPRIPYWLATLFPMSVAGAYLWRTR
jgi:hypothetical protein